MNEIIYGIVSGVNTVGSVTMAVISVIAEVLSIIKTVSPRSTIGKRMLWICVLIVATSTLMGLFYGNSLTKVPDVIGYTIEDAHRKLSDVELKYNLSTDTGTYVTEQSINPGEIVKKGTEVRLSTKDISTNNDVVSNFEEKIQAEYGKLALSFYDVEIILRNGNETISCFGPNLCEYSVVDACLYNAENNIKYNSVVVQNGFLIFPKIPKGINFELTVLIDGYKKISETDICLSAENMKDGVFNLSIGIINNNKEFGLAHAFQVIDENDKALGNVELQIKWANDDYWYGDYFTDTHGIFEHTIWINTDMNVDICVVNPFGDGCDYYSSAPIYKYQTGDSPTNSKVVIKRGG
jgi:hypothetical protein